jgi:hypothetical protein
MESTPETEPLKPGPDPTPSQAQCSVCRQTFGGVSLFDAHRTGPVDRRVCSDPRTMVISGFGLHLTESGVWRSSAPRPATAPGGPQAA